MSEFVYLVGGEGVERAGRAMQSAADDMLRAASYAGESISGLARFVERVEIALAEHADRLERLASGPAVLLDHRGAPIGRLVEP